MSQGYKVYAEWQAFGKWKFKDVRKLIKNGIDKFGLVHVQVGAASLDAISFHVFVGFSQL